MEQLIKELLRPKRMCHDKTALVECNPDCVFHKNNTCQFRLLGAYLLIWKPSEYDEKEIRGILK